MIAAREAFLGQAALRADSRRGERAGGPGWRRPAPPGRASCWTWPAGPATTWPPCWTALPGRTGICLDLSKPALRKAARAHPRAVAVGSDVWRRFPLADGSAAIVLSVFGPRHLAETIRVLGPAGVFLLVTPGPRHLAELVGALGLLSVDTAKPQRVAAATAGLEQIAGEDLTLPAAARSRRPSVTWSAWAPVRITSVPAQLADRIAALADPLTVTASVTVAAYRLR